MAMRDCLRQLRSVANGRFRLDLTVADLECVDPALAAREDAHEVAKLHKLRLGEVLLELSPERVICARRVPGNRVCVAEGHFLALGETWRRLVVVDLRKSVLGDGMLSGPDRALDRSIGAVERPGNSQPE